MKRATWINLAILQAAVTIGLSAGHAEARSDLLCNKPQTKCLIGGKDLTIGDRVGIFNNDGELVAEGEIESLRGERRAVLINKRHGIIRRGYNLTLLNSPGFGQSSGVSAYRVYREPALMSVGASAGIANVSIGEGSPASELSAYAQWRKWYGMQIVARGTYMAVEGATSRISDAGYLESRSLSASAFELLGGAAYILRENQPLSFRGELSLGLAHVSADVDGDKSLVDGKGFKTNIKNGIGPAGRLSLGIMYNFANSWHVHGDFAAGMVQAAFAKTIAAGISKDLK